MDEKFELNESELDTVQGGMMTIHGKSKVMEYLQPDGTTVNYSVLGDSYATYKRCMALHNDYDDEDYILSVLQNEGYIGSRI